MVRYKLYCSWLSVALPCQLSALPVALRPALLPPVAPAGTQTTESEVKKGFKLPRSCMTNADVTRLINSDEVQSVVNAPKEGAAKHYALKKNPLKNLGALIKLNPHAASARR